MNRLELPVNISLMDTNSDRVKSFPKITSLDTFDGGSTSNFHPEGLFSDRIFGRVGTPERDKRFAFIHTKIIVLNPFIYQKLTRLKSLYKDIMLGKRYAEWNPVKKDFEPSDIINGETGYNFFMSKLRDIEFALTESVSREINVQLLNKAIKEGTAFITAVPVIPAGLRDAYIETDGRVAEDEINPLYRSILSATKSLPDNIDYNDDSFNTTRVSIQNGVNKVFEYLWNLYKGKRGFSQNQFYSRAVFNGTRNVLTALNAATPELGVAHTPKMNNTVLGLFQTLKGLLPVAQHLILNGWLSDVFSAGDGKAHLVNTKTLQMETVGIPRKVFDRFTTPEGIAKSIDVFFDRELRKKPVMIEGRYVGLVYRGEIGGKKVFKFFNDINDLPDGLKTDDVHPITWVELFYVAGYRHWNNYPGTNTRYPVSGLGSTYTSYAYVKTTTIGEQRYELDSEWNIMEFHDDNPIKYAYEYPRADLDKFVETMSVAVSRIGGLGADLIRVSPL